MWFDMWADVWRTLFVGASAYAVLVLALRFSGKRTLSQLNAFDFIVTVALGSTLATILLSTDVSLAEGIVALGLLIGLQFLVAFVASRIPAFQKVVKSEPTALVIDGVIQHEAIKLSRLTMEEVNQVIRSSGVGDASLCAAVVLETNGTMSVVTHQQRGSGSSLTDIKGFRRS